MKRGRSKNYPFPRSEKLSLRLMSSTRVARSFNRLIAMRENIFVKSGDE